jgi:hypothetical protein
MLDIDESSPIPNLTVVDVNKIKKGGGADLYVVAASPIPGTKQELERLLQKVENYLAHINSDAFRSECGVPTAENTKIIVKLHPDSDPLARTLLEPDAEWIANNSATLVIDTNLP